MKKQTDTRTNSWNKKAEMRSKFSQLFTILVLLVLVTLSASSVLADWTISGDSPNGKLINVLAYSGAQATPCDGVVGAGDTGILYWQTGLFQGNNIYNANDDYSKQYVGASGGYTLWIYTCNSLNSKEVQYSTTINDGDSREIDWGYIQATAGASNSDTYSDNVYVCNASNGARLDTINEATNVGDGSYDHYFTIDDGSSLTTADNLPSALILFDNDFANPCVLDSTVSTGKRINTLTETPDNYAVFGYFEPNRKVIGDLHTDLAGAEFDITTTTGAYSVGMVNQDYTGVIPDGLNDANDDLVMYYDQDASGYDYKISMVTAAGLTETISAMSNTFSNLDLVVKISGTVPSTIEEVRTTVGLFSYKVTPVSGVYTLYVPASVGAINIEFAEIASGASVFEKSVTIGDPFISGGAGFEDKTINVGRLHGETHTNLESGNDEIEVYNDNACTVQVSEAARTINPSNDAGNGNPGDDYEIYYEDDGSVTYYTKTIMDATFETCGNAFTITPLTYDNVQDIVIEVNGTVQSDIDRAEIDYDQNDVYDANDAFTADFSSGVYHIFGTSDATTNMLYNASGSLELTRAKDLTSDKTVNVGKLSGETHADLYLGVITVYDSITNTNLLSSELRNPANNVGVDYTIFFEANSATPLVSTYYINAITSDGFFETNGNGFTLDAGYAQTKDLVVEKTGVVPSAISRIAIDLDENSTIDNSDAYTYDIVGVGQVYKLFTVADASADVLYATGAYNDVLKIDENFAAGTYENNISALQGDVPAGLASGTVEIEKAGILYSNNDCGGASYATTNINADVTGSPDYAFFYQADGTTYDVLYCNGATKELKLSFTADTSGNNLVTLDVAEVTGDAHANLANSLDGTDNIEVCTDMSCTDVVSTETEQPAATYTQYFWEKPLPVSTYYLKVTMDNGASFITFGNEMTGVNPGDTITKSLASETTGTVHTEIDRVEVDYAKDGFDSSDIYTTTTGVYHLFGTDVDNDVDVLFYTTAGTVLELTRNKDVSGASTQVDVAKLEGTIEESFDTASASTLFVYDSYPGSPLNSQYIVNDNGAGNDDDFYSFFETTSTVTDGFVDVKFQSDAVLVNEFTVRKNLDNNPTLNTVNAITGGDLVSLDMTSILSGTLPPSVSSISAVEYNDAAEVREISKLYVTGTWPHTYTMYYDASAVQSTDANNWHLDIYDEIISGDVSPRKVLSIIKNTGAQSQIGLTFNVAKVLGEAHSDLESGDDKIEVSSAPDCSALVSTEVYNPIDNGFLGNVNDYTAYYEDTGAGSYYLKTTMVDGTDNFVSCGNEITGVAPGDSDVQDLVVEKKGYAFSGMTKVGIDLDQDSTDDSFTTYFNGSNYYRVFSTIGPDATSNVNYYEGVTPILTLVDDFSTASSVTNNIFRVTGVVPAEFDTKVFELEVTGSGYVACDGAGIDTDTAVVANALDYKLYAQADGASYDVLFCNGATLELKKTISTAGFTGGETVYVNVSEFTGEAHSGIENGLDGADTIVIYNNSADCIANTNPLSSEIEQPADNGAGVDYTQYYVSNDAQVYYMKITKTDATGTYNTCLALNGAASPAIDTANLDVEVNGKVQADVLRVAIDINAVVTGDDAFTTSFNAMQYYLYTTAGDATDVANFYDANSAGNLLLTRAKDLTSDKTVNVGKISGASHADLNGGTIEIWDTIDTATNMFSSQTVNFTAGTYAQYFEANSLTPDTSNYYIKASTSDGFISRGNMFNIALATFAKSLDLTVEKTGLVTDDITKVALDLDESGSVDATDVYTNPVANTYKVFTTTGDATVDIRYYVGATDVLKIDEDLSAANTHVNHISKLIGDAPASLNGGTVEIEKSGVSYSNGLCGGAMYNNAIITTASTPDYTVYYQADATNYDLLYCDGITTVLDWTILSDGVGNQTKTINLAKVAGNIEDTNDGTFEVYDDMNTATLLSSVSTYNEAVTDTYELYFVQSDDVQNINVNITDLKITDTTGLVSWRFKVDKTPNNYPTFDAIVGGDSITLDLVNKLSGTVDSTISQIDLADKTDLYTTATETLATGITTATNYAMYFDTLTTVNNWYTDAYDGTTLVISRNKNAATNLIGATFDVGTVVGSIDASFTNATVTSQVGQTPSIDVYSAWNNNAPIGTPFNSHAFITDGADSYKVYVETTAPGITNPDLRFIDSNGYNSWSMDFAVAMTLDDSNALNADYTVSGDTPLETNAVVTLEDGIGTMYSAGIAKADGTYKSYTPLIDATPQNIFKMFYRNTVTDELLRRDTSSATFSVDTTFDVAKITGTIEQGFTDGTGAGSVDVSDDIFTPAVNYGDSVSDSIPTVFNVDGVATDSYEEWFEVTPALTQVDVEYTDKDSYVSWANDVAGVTPGATITLNLQNIVSGSIPSDVDYTYVYDGATLLTAAEDNAGSYRAYVTQDYTAASTYDYAVDNYGVHTGVELLRDSGISTFATNDNWDVSKISGGLDADFKSGITGNEKFQVVDDWTGVPATYNTDGAGNNYWFINTVPPVASDDNTVEKYEVYFEHQAGTVYDMIITESDLTVDHTFYMNDVDDASWGLDSDGISAGETQDWDLTSEKSGEVTEEALGLPVGNVNVTLSNNDGLPTIGAPLQLFTVTQSDSTYTFYTIPKVYDIKFTKLGYVYAYESEKDLNADVLNNNIELKYTVKINLTDIGSQPLNATVWIFNTTNETATINTDGMDAQLVALFSNPLSEIIGPKKVYFFPVVGPTNVGVKITKAGFVTILDLDYENANATFYLADETIAQQTLGSTYHMDNAPANIVQLVSPSDATLTNDNTVDLTWQDQTGEESYNIVVGTDATFTTIVIDANTTSNVATYTTAILADGTYSWKVRAKDSLGYGDWSETRSFTVGTTEPVFTSTTVASFNTKSVLLTGTTNEDATCRFSTSDEAYSSMPYAFGPITTQSFAANYVASEGANTIYVRCQDTAGNAATSSIVIEFTVDSIAPYIISASPNGGYYNTPQVISIITDENAYCRYFTQDISYTAMTSDFQFDIASEGTTIHTVTPTPAEQGLIHYYVRCIDATQANEMSSSVITYYYYDTVAPTYTLIDKVTSSGTDYVTDDSTVTLIIKSSEDLVTDPEILLDATGPDDSSVSGNVYTYSWIITPDFADGPISLTVTGGTDAAGNIDAGNYIQNGVVTVDRTPPSISNIYSIDLDDDGVIVAGQAITFTVNEIDSEAGLTGTITVTGDDSNVVVDARALTDNHDGTYSYVYNIPVDETPQAYVVTAILTDSLGNSDNTESITFPYIVISAGGPVIETLSATPTSTVNTNIDLSATAVSMVSKISNVEYKIGTGSLVDMTSDGAYDSTTESTTITISVDDLDEGDNIIYVHARDEAGNYGPYETVTVFKDSIAPSISSVDSLDNLQVYSNGDQIRILVDALESGLTVTADFGNIDSEYNAGTETVVDNKDGTYTITYVISKQNVNPEDTYSIIVSAVDSLGNAALTNSSLSLDLNNPITTVSIITPNNGIVTNADQTVKITAPDNTDSLTLTSECIGGVETLTNAEWASYNWLVSSCGFDGNKTLTAEAFDIYGTSLGSDSVTITKDTTAPSTPTIGVVNSNSDGYDTDGTLTWQWTTAEDTYAGVDYYEIQVNSVVMTTKLIGTSFTSSDLSDGTHTAQVRAVDKLGITGEWSTLVSITVDKTKPSTVTVTGLNLEEMPYDTNNDYQITWSDATDTNGIASYDVMINDDVTTGVLNPLAQSPGDGNYRYQVRAVDAAGNVGDWSDVYTVIVDTTAPSVSIINPLAEKVTGTSLTLLSYTNEDATCEYSLNGADYAIFDTTGQTMHQKALSGLNAGVNSISVRCLDNAGNPNTPVSVSWMVTDETAYIASSSLSPYYSTGVVTMTARAMHPDNAAIQQVEYCIKAIGQEAPTDGVNCDGNLLSAKDGAFDEPQEQVTGTLNTAGLVDGSYVVYTHVKAADTWGPFDADGFTLDTQAPVITDVMPNTNIKGTEGTDVKVSAQTSEPATCTIIDVASMSGINTEYHEYTIPGLSDGSKSYTITCTDRAGLTGTSVVNFIIDSSAPTALITSPTGILAENEFMVAWTGSDIGVGIDSYTVQYSNDSGSTWNDWKIDTRDVEDSFIAQAGDVIHFRVKAKDLVGNEGSYSDVWTVQIQGFGTYGYAEQLGENSVWDHFFLPIFILQKVGVTNYSVSNVLSSITGQYKELYYKSGPNAQDLKFGIVYSGVYYPTGGLSNFTDNENKPYWIKMNQISWIRINNPT